VNSEYLIERINEKDLPVKATVTVDKAGGVRSLDGGNYSDGNLYF